MAPHRRIDVVLDSVRRLLRIGATANLFNLLQKQHPADLAAVYGELQERDRGSVFEVEPYNDNRYATHWFAKTL